MQTNDIFSFLCNSFNFKIGFSIVGLTNGWNNSFALIYFAYLKSNYRAYLQPHVNRKWRKEVPLNENAEELINFHA